MNKLMKRKFEVATREPKVQTARAQQVKEFYFVIAPPRHILSDVSVLKDDVHYLVGRELEDRYSRASIALFRYSDSEHHMKHLLRFVEARAAEFSPFNVFLKDFGVFFNGSKRSIYMDVVNKFYIQDIFERLVKEGTSYTPHITIAKNLDEEEYLRCWPYLKGLNYSNQHFLCDRITVLAKTSDKWIHYKDIEFGGAIS
jgi:hypothetical protein